jgi:hypothetical protein
MWTHQLAKNRQLILVVLTETVTDADLLNIEAQIRETPAYATGIDVLVDGANVSDLRVSGSGLYALAKRTQNDSNLIAIIARPGFMYGMARMYEIMANWKLNRVQVFASRWSAVQWLDDRRSARNPSSIDRADQICR